MNQEEEKLREYASIIREMIRHENIITNHRLMWMLVMEGILFAGAAFVVFLSLVNKVKL